MNKKEFEEYMLSYTGNNDMKEFKNMLKLRSNRKCWIEQLVDDLCLSPVLEGEDRAKRLLLLMYMNNMNKRFKYNVINYCLKNYDIDDE